MDVAQCISTGLMRSCRVRLGDVEGAIITTIEGLSATSDHPVQKAWVELQVPQCGYCHSGADNASRSIFNRKYQSYR